MKRPNAKSQAETARRPSPGVIDRMVTADLLKTLVAILLVLVVIIVSRQFLSILQKAIEGEVSADTLFQLLGLKTVAATAILIPPSLFMAILTVIGRMYRDQEMAVLASAGAGELRIMQALCWAVFPVFLLSTYLALVAMPWTERHTQKLIKRDEQKADVRGIQPGRFNEFSAGDIVLYAESIDPNSLMHEIFVQSRQGESTAVVIAESGHLQKTELGEDFVILNKGRRYQGIPGQMDFVISDFAEYGVRILGPEAESEALKREATDSLTLLKSRDPKELGELLRRLAIPLGVIFLSLLAVPLARIAPRRGPYGNVFTALLIYIIYENLLKIAQGMVMTKKLKVWQGPLVIYGVLLLLSLFLYFRGQGSILHKLGFRGRYR